MTVTLHELVPHAYRDSVVLMQLSGEVSGQPGVEESAVMMGTPANLEVLRESGLIPTEAMGIDPDSIVISVKANDEASASQAIDWAKDSLTSSRHISRSDGSVSGEEAETAGFLGWRHLPDQAKLALISVPGEYAASETWKALRSGRHVFLFSDHVSIEDEVALKRAGQDRGLLVMGPECGTSLINGVPLGFANRVNRGPIGLVAASGSGLQEIICLIDHLGSGVSHGIGTGGRDLSPEVGGLTMQQGIDLLLQDEATKVLVLLSKPPSPQVASHILSKVEDADKPVVVCFLGADSLPTDSEHIHLVKTLEEAARLAVELAEGGDTADLDAVKLPPVSGRPVLRGLFTGGTLAYEAMVILHEQVGPMWSNKPLDSLYQLGQGDSTDSHICLDLGAEEYTVGRPHPMIDPAIRANLLLEMARNVEQGVFLLDFVLGVGSHRDPVGAMLPAIEEAQTTARADNRQLWFVASVTGTDADPQPRHEQVKKLEQHGITVAPSNASAARVAAQIIVSI